jgi:hypothetical protein
MLKECSKVFDQAHTACSLSTGCSLTQLHHHAANGDVTASICCVQLWAAAIVHQQQPYSHLNFSGQEGAIQVLHCCYNAAHLLCLVAVLPMCHDLSAVCLAFLSCLGWMGHIALLLSVESLEGSQCSGNTALPVDILMSRFSDSAALRLRRRAMVVWDKVSREDVWSPPCLPCSCCSSQSLVMWQPYFQAVISYGQHGAQLY